MSRVYMDDCICQDCANCDIAHDLCKVKRMRYPTTGCFDFVLRDDPDGDNALTRGLKAIKNHLAIEIRIQLKPFTVPNFVIAQGKTTPRQEGFKELPSYPLSELASETLDEMCAEFRRGVFEKAGKPLPESKR